MDMPNCGQRLLSWQETMFLIEAVRESCGSANREHISVMCCNLWYFT